MNIAPRMARLGTESAFEVLARAKQLERAGREIVHLEIGEPDFDTPNHIKDAAKQALDAGATHYGPAAGLPELREARRRFAETSLALMDFLDARDRQSITRLEADVERLKRSMDERGRERPELERM